MLARSTQPVPIGQPRRRETPYLPTPKRRAACQQNCTCAGQLVRRSAWLSARAKKAGAAAAHLAFSTSWAVSSGEELDSSNQTSAAHVAKRSRRITAEPVSHIAGATRMARQQAPLGRFGFSESWTADDAGIVLLALPGSGGRRIATGQNGWKCIEPSGYERLE
jgi:hypothetical protein